MVDFGKELRAHLQAQDKRTVTSDTVLEVVEQSKKFAFLTCINRREEWCSDERVC